MDTPSSAQSPRAGIVLLLAAALCINYIDRGSLSTLAPMIMDELHLSPEQFGYLSSAFFSAYVLAMMPAGWLAERFGARRVLTAGVLVWSMATLLTGFANGLAMLFALRLLLGLGESVAFPSVSKILAVVVPESGRGRANGTTGFGYLIGPAIGTLVGGLLMSRIGWRNVFVIFGCASLLWLWPWLRVRIAEAATTTRKRADAPTSRQILRQRGLWGASLGHFAGNYNFYFVLTWMPVYLVKYRHFETDEMAATGTTAYVLTAVCAVLMGAAADRWVRAGRSRNAIYKGAMALNHVATIGCMAGMALLPAGGLVACLFVFAVVTGLSSPGYYAIPQTMAGPLAAGRWVGVQNTCGNIAGIIAPAMTGILVQLSGGRYESAFALAAAMNLLGLAGWVWILPRIAPVDWTLQRA
ncbi:MAG TPA: MFS transporter [Steroidobacteraceae bacterium]|nr:MFS transporter [Steroidobacteraceae bacterium]